MKSIILCCLLVAAAVGPGVCGAEPPVAQEAAYEYASVRFDGDQTTIIWPDGSTQRVIPFGGRKRPEKADHRLWYLTGAMNIMSQKGFELAHMNEADVIMKRRIAKATP